MFQILCKSLAHIFREGEDRTQPGRKASEGVSCASAIRSCSSPNVERRAAQHPYLRAKEQHLLSAILAPFDVIPIDNAVVEIYGRVRTVLENSGTAIGALDTFIAAQALSLGATLVTINTKEFARQIEDWR